MSRWCMSSAGALHSSCRAGSSRRRRATVLLLPAASSIRPGRWRIPRCWISSRPIARITRSLHKCSGFLDGDDCAHGVTRAWSECDGVFRGIRGFDGEHFVPLPRPKVGQFIPWVPYDRRIGVFFADDDAALHRAVVNNAGGRGVVVDAVGKTSEREGRVGRGNALHVVRLVDVAGGFETGDGNFVNVGDRVVTVEGFFKAQWLVVVIGDGHRQRQNGADGEHHLQMKMREAKRAAEVVGAKVEREYGVVAGANGGAQGPLADTREAVRRAWMAVDAIALAVCREPRKCDGDAAADRLTGKEIALATEEDYRLLRRRLPRGQVRALEIDRRSRMGSSNVGAYKGALPIECEKAG